MWNNLSRNFGQSAGYRNKNPGNVENNPANRWLGSTGEDSSGQAIFTDTEGVHGASWGVRAMGICLLKKYRGTDCEPLKTIRGIITGSDDKTTPNEGRAWTHIVRDWEPYITVVSRSMFALPSDRDMDLSSDTQLKMLIQAMAWFEIGAGFHIPNDLVDKGVEMAHSYFG